MNSENFGIIIAANKALDRKIWLCKVWRGKWSFLKVLEGTCGIFEWLEALARNN
jgi:hypothetical protein